MDLPYSHQLKNAEKVLASYEAIAARADDMTRPLVRFGEYHTRKTARVLRSGERGVRARHAEGLAGALTYNVWFGAQLREGSNTAYGAALHFGNVNRSSRPGGYLAIPIADNVTANGDPRFVSPRLVPDGFFFRSERSGALLYARVNNRIEQRRRRARGRASASLRRWNRDLGSRLELLFVLKREVVIPSRPYMTFDPADLQVWDGYVNDWVLRGR